MGSSDALTDGIRVVAQPFYIAEQSDPLRDLYVYGYKIQITNEGEDPAQLVSRHWVITDAQGRVEEVRGPGVVGETPRLGPGERFEYTSGCPLPTERGTMHGTYQMVRDDGTRFDARIAPFTMSLPQDLN